MSIICVVHSDACDHFEGTDEEKFLIRRETHVCPISMESDSRFEAARRPRHYVIVHVVVGV